MFSVIILMAAKFRSTPTVNFNQNGIGQSLADAFAENLVLVTNVIAHDLYGFAQTVGQASNLPNRFAPSSMLISGYLSSSWRVIDARAEVGFIFGIEMVQPSLKF